MERILNALRFSIKRTIKVSDPAVRQEGEAHLAALDALEAEQKPVQGYAYPLEAVDAEPADVAPDKPADAPVASEPAPEEK